MYNKLSADSPVARAAAFAIAFCSYLMLREASGIKTHPWSEHQASWILILFAFLGLYFMAHLFLGLAEHGVNILGERYPERKASLNRLFKIGVVSLGILFFAAWLVPRLRLF